LRPRLPVRRPPGLAAMCGALWFFMSSSVSRRQVGAPAPGLVLFVLAIGAFAIGTTEFATMSLLPYFAPDLGVDAPAAGHVISAYALGVVVGAPILTVLAARMARRTLLIWLMGVFALFNGLCAFAPNYETMLVLRFLSGLPHGAYFGIASLVAVSLVPLNKRNQAVGRMFLGLTVATIIGVPFANWLGQAVGWRWGFAMVAFTGLLTAVLVALVAPYSPPKAGASPLRELGALRHGQVWLTLGVGAIGFGGLFCVYTYLADTLMAVTGVAPARVPVVLGIFGLGMTFGQHHCALVCRPGVVAHGGRLAALERAVHTVVCRGGAQCLGGVAERIYDRHGWCVGHCSADAPDGCGARRPGPGSRPQSFCIQPCQCAGPLVGWAGNFSGAGLGVHRLGGQPAGTGGGVASAAVGLAGPPGARCGAFSSVAWREKQWSAARNGGAAIKRRGREGTRCRLLVLQRSVARICARPRLCDARHCVRRRELACLR